MTEKLENSEATKTCEAPATIEEAVRNAVSQTVKGLPHDGRCPAWLGSLAVIPDNKTNDAEEEL